LVNKNIAEQRRRNMQAVKSKDSNIEVLLRKELWARGYRYRKNVNRIIGKPDIAFIGRKVAVFCDSEFWHGYDWENKQEEIKSNREFWLSKIEANMKRDQIVTEQLTQKGWIVLRFWGRDIKKDLDNCVRTIERQLIQSQAPEKENSSE